MTVNSNSEDKTKIALSHVNIENLDIKLELIRGDIEPLVGREWNERGSGQKISQIAKICIAPGSCLHLSSEFIIGGFGIWDINTKRKSDLL